MLKWIVIIVACFCLYKLVMNEFRKKQEKKNDDSQKDLERKVANGEMVKDPQCGTWVSVDESISVRDGAKVYHFCSYDCRDRFLDALAKGGREIPGGKG